MAKYDFEALKAKVDIVKVISHYIDVTKKGNGYAALCPFHNDSNPSLSFHQASKFLIVLFVILEVMLFRLFPNIKKYHI